MIGEEAIMGNPSHSRGQAQRHKAKTPRKPPTPEPTTAPEMTTQPSIDTGPVRTPSPRRPFVGFDRERITYERLKPELLTRAECKYVVLVGDEIAGPLDSHEDAEKVGYLRFGLGPLYIRQVLAEESVSEVTRYYTA
jgi:hypothetical protein